MELKNIGDFINESYNNDYLAVIINKLKSEDKTNAMIFTYLDLLNIPKDRIMQSMSACGCLEESAITEGELDDLVDDIDDEAEDDKKDSEEKEEAGAGEDDKKSKKGDDDDDDDDEEDSSTGDKKKALKDAVEDIEMVAKAIKSVKDIASSSEPIDEE